MRFSISERRAEARQEARVRRAFAKRGLALVRSRARRADHPLRGTYGVIDTEQNVWVWAGPEGYGYSLGDAENWLS